MTKIKPEFFCVHCKEIMEEHIVGHCLFSSEKFSLWNNCSLNDNECWLGIKNGEFHYHCDLGLYLVNYSFNKFIDIVYSR